MEPKIEPTLYIDIQAAKPACLCSRCGGAVYWPGLYCLRCQVSGHDTA